MGYRRKKSRDAASAWRRKAAATRLSRVHRLWCSFSWFASEIESFGIAAVGEDIALGDIRRMSFTLPVVGFKLGFDLRTAGSNFTSPNSMIGILFWLVFIFLLALSNSNPL